jgi:hypothetical protein
MPSSKSQRLADFILKLGNAFDTNVLVLWLPFRWYQVDESRHAEQGANGL